MTGRNNSKRWRLLCGCMTMMMTMMINIIEADFNNPSFEYGVKDGEFTFVTGSVESWQPNYNYIEVWGNGHGGITPQGGSNFVELNAQFQGSGFSQNIEVEPNTEYTLFWYMRSRDNYTQYIELRFDDVPQQSFDNTGNLDDWIKVTYLFTSPSDVSQLNIGLFGFTDNPDKGYGNLVDSFHIIRIADPVTLGGGNPAFRTSHVNPSLIKLWEFAEFGGSGVDNHRKQP